MSSILNLIRKQFRKRGFIIQKYPASDFGTLPVFDICVEFMMSRIGTDIDFIQIGANDGIFRDPLRKYILNYPWRGVLVEPQADIFEKLRLNYSDVIDRLIFENCAISNRIQELSMFRRKSQNGTSCREVLASSVVSSSSQVVASQLGVKKSELEEIKVPCLTLDALVSRHEMRNLDLLQIDAEGHDFEVISTMDLSQTKPSLIQLEHGHLRPAEISQLVTYLNKNNYDVLYGGYQADTVAMHSELLMN